MVAFMACLVYDKVMTKKNSIQRSCSFCGDQYWVQPCRADLIKSCGKPECKQKAKRRHGKLFVCEHCGETYFRGPAAIRQGRISHTLKCKMALHRETRICAGEDCDTTFEVKKTSDQKYCSNRCKIKNGIARKTGMFRNCPICGVRFWTTPVADKNYCQSCFNSTKRKGEFRACAACGKTFWTAPSSNHKFCSLACVTRQGAFNGNWRGGLSNEPYSLEFNGALKTQIRQRDGNACQICGVKQSDLNVSLPVHHIDYNKLNHDPQNLIALCPSCHSKTNGHRTQWQKRLAKKTLTKTG